MRLLLSVSLFLVVPAFAVVSIPPAELIESTTYRLRVNTKRPIELSQAAYRSLRTLIENADEEDRRNLADFELREVLRYASLRNPNRTIELTDEERHWLLEAKAGVIERNETGRRLNERLRAELGVELDVLLVESRVFRDRPIGLTPGQAKFFDLAQSRSNSFLSPAEIGKALGWTEPDLAHVLVDHVEAINDEAVTQTGAPVFLYREKRGFFFRESPARVYPSDEAAGEAVLAALDPQGPAAHVIVDRSQIEKIDLPLSEVLRLLNGLHMHVAKLDIRLHGRTLRFEWRDGRMQARGCATDLRPAIPGAS